MSQFWICCSVYVPGDPPLLIRDSESTEETDQNSWSRFQVLTLTCANFWQVSSMAMSRSERRTTPSVCVPWRVRANTPFSPAASPESDQTTPPFVWVSWRVRANTPPALSPPHLDFSKKKSQLAFFLVPSRFFFEKCVCRTRWGEEEGVVCSDSSGRRECHCL